MEYVKLSNIALINAGGTPSRNNNKYWNGDIPWLKISDIKGKYTNSCTEFITEEGLNNSSAKYFDANTILYTIFATVGETSILNFKSTTNQAIAGIKLITNDYIIDYLYYYLKSIKNKVKFDSKGVAQNNINLTYLKNLNVPIMTKNKQQEIVCNLSKIEKLIEYYKSIILNLETIVKSQFIEMFGDCKNHDLIGNVLNICRGASPRPISNFITSDADGVNWIKIGDVDENSLYITSTDEKITRDGALKSRFVKPGDFILSNSMSFGRPYILGINGCVHDGWLILSDYENTFNPLYLYHAIRDDEIQYQFNGKANGATVRNLNSELVRNTSIKIPPIELQNKFASFVQQIDKSKYFGGAYYGVC